MNKILIVTTQGCEACNIAINNVKAAVEQSSKDIEIEVKDWHDFPRKFITSNKIKDYPTAIFCKHPSVINFKCSGSYPAAVYLRWIDLHL